MHHQNRFVTVALAFTASAALVISPALAQSQTPVPGLQDAPFPAASKQLRSGKNTGLQYFSPTLAKSPVSFKNSADYKHDSGLFTIQMPVDWQSKDISTEDDVHVAFIDPTQSAIFLARVVQPQQPLDEDGMIDFLSGYVRGQFGKERKYATNDVQDLGKGTFGTRFTFDARIGGKTRSMVGDAFALQAGPLASTIVFITGADIYDQIQDDAYKVLTSYQIVPEAIGTNQTLPDDFDMSELVTFEHPSGAFKIDVPAAWEKIDKSEDAALLTGWVEPQGRGEVVVELVKVEKTFTRNQIRDMVAKYAENAYGDKPAFTAAKPKVHSNNVSSVLIALDRETDTETVRLVGLIYAWQTGDNVAFLRVLVPESRASEVAGQVDNIVNSFSVDTTVNYLK
jgi:hypothetical protein